jgi:predicted lactoylglutathione lyase
MGVKASQIFVNVPVKDLNRTNDFFAEIGFEFNQQFSNEHATCMVIGDNIFAMLLAEESFKAFTNKEIADATKSTEVILAISAESRAQVDEIVNKALAAGGKPSNDPIDHGFMYGWSFQDVDGHLWEVFYMDANAVEQG